MTIKKQNLNAIEGRAAPNRTIMELFSAATLDAEGVTVRVVDLVPMSEQEPRRPHWHPDFEEVIYFMKGKGHMWLDGEWHDVEAGDTILVPAGVAHATFNVTEEPLRLFCFFPRAVIEPFSFADEYLTLP